MPNSLNYHAAAHPFCVFVVEGASQIPDRDDEHLLDHVDVMESSASPRLAISNATGGGDASPRSLRCHPAAGWGSPGDDPSEALKRERVASSPLRTTGGGRRRLDDTRPVVVMGDIPSSDSKDDGPVDDAWATIPVRERPSLSVQGELVSNLSKSAIRSASVHAGWLSWPVRKDAYTDRIDEDGAGAISQESCHENARRGAGRPVLACGRCAVFRFCRRGRAAP